MLYENEIHAVEEQDRKYHLVDSVWKTNGFRVSTCGGDIQCCWLRNKERNGPTQSQNLTQAVCARMGERETLEFKPFDQWLAGTIWVFLLRGKCNRKHKTHRMILVHDLEFVICNCLHEICIKFFPLCNDRFLVKRCQLQALEVH